MSVKGYVWWSIYVRTSSRRKLQDVHLPPIREGLETLHFEFEVIAEPENPGLFRLVTYQNLRGDVASDVIVPVLRRAYRLADGWTISGLGNIAHVELHHVIGGWTKRVDANKPPATESMMFELLPGEITGLTADGGWQVAE